MAWGFPGDAGAATVEELLRRDSIRQGIIESAGIFWLAAEVLILMYVLAVLAHLRNGATSSQLRFPTVTRTWALWVVAGFLALGVIVWGRLFGAVLIGEAPATPEGVTAVGERRTTLHLAIWSVFITGWVALEIAIVFAGLRAYRMLRGVLREP